MAGHTTFGKDREGTRNEVVRIAASGRRGMLHDVRHLDASSIYGLSEWAAVPGVRLLFIHPIGANPGRQGASCAEPYEPAYMPCRLARCAPSASALSLAQAICGWVRPPKPQSAPAMTFSAPTRRAKRRMRWATSSGCSTPSVACEIMPG